MRTVVSRYCLFLGRWLLLSPLVTFAHHSVVAFFDQGTVSELEGTITRVVWRNPHVVVVLLTGGEQWELQSAAMNVLERNGITRDSFGIGDRVRVAGWPSRRGRNEMFVTNVLLPNGNELQTTARPQPLRWTEDSRTAGIDVAAGSSSESRGRGIFRVWARERLYGSNPRNPLLFTPGAVAARLAWDPLTDDPSLRCIPPGLPNAMLSPFPFEFIDEGDTIRLRVEEWDAVRTIHMTSEQDPATVTPSSLGHSVGRWEGRTLVVHTSRIDWPLLDGDGTPQSDDVEIVERFTISEDENRLDFEITATDPEYLAEPAIWDAGYIWNPGVDIKPFECAFDPVN